MSNELIVEGHCDCGAYLPNMDAAIESRYRPDRHGMTVPGVEGLHERLCTMCGADVMVRVRSDPARGLIAERAYPDA